MAKLGDKEIEIELTEVQERRRGDASAPPGMEEMTNRLQNMFQNMKLSSAAAAAVNYT